MSIIPLDLISKTPGFTGRLTKWIIQTALYPQPQLALAAAIAATGTLKGQKVRSETDLRTNHLIVGLGLPSSGKGHAIGCLDRLFHEIGAEERIAGVPVSDSGLLSCLTVGTGVKLIQWDEIGLGLSKITNSKAPSYKANILNIIMQLFSSASRTYRGNEYANKDGKSPRLDINQPCLNIYGVSTPVRFFEALNSDFGSDGFLSRLLIFETSPDHPSPAVRPEGAHIPDALAKSARFILDEAPSQEEPENDLIDIPLCKEIKYSQAAYTYIQGILFPHFDRLKRQASSEIIQSVYGRALEHILKLALTVEPKDEISKETLLWAEDVYSHLSDSLIKIIQSKVTNSEFEKNLNKIIEILKVKPLTQSQIYNQTRWLSRRDRNDLIQTLVESDRVVTRREILPNHCKPTTFYHLATTN